MYTEENILWFSKVNFDRLSLNVCILQSTKDIYIAYLHSWVSLMAQMVKNLPAKQEIWVCSLSQEDPLEKGMAIHSSILAWRISWIEEPSRLQSLSCKESDISEQLTLPLFT